MKKSIIGIIGVGTVGSACKFGFEKLGHKVLIHDIKFNTKIEDLLISEVIFICVPTPSSEDGSCDISILEDVVSDLSKLNYKGIVALKSTIQPGTTKELQRKYENLELCFVPEFLRERCAISDFVENHILLAVGTQKEKVYEKIVNIHGSYPQKTIMIGTSESEALKYYSNVFNALRIIFANEFYELCNKLDINYTDVKNAYILTGAVPDKYLDVNENFRGYGGICLPKDVKAIAYLLKKHNLNKNLIDTIDKENNKYETTVFSGMRLK